MRSEDWSRMSWHARQRFMKRYRPRPVPVATPVVEPVPVRRGLNDGIVRRCGDCGAWMIDVCNTDHGRRYEP